MRTEELMEARVELAVLVGNSRADFTLVADNGLRLTSSPGFSAVWSSRWL